jgi:thiamine pyrophosphate-dependent acetolactate synthase large subunit-like protein
LESETQMHSTEIDRREILREIFPDHRRFLFVSGLAGSARDCASLTDDGNNLFALGGAMGAASMIGLGMALAAASRDFVVVTGDGELLMNLGCLVTIATAQPENLAIVCLDNGRHGETGNQPGHTSGRADLEAIARGSGFTETMTLRDRKTTKAAADFIARRGSPRLLVVKVLETPPSPYKRLMDPAACRIRFRTAFLGSRLETSFPPANEASR